MGYSAIGSSGGGGSTPTAPTWTAGTFGLSSNVVHTSGAINTKGAPTALGTLTGDIDDLVLRLQGTSGRFWLLDILVDGVVKVADLPYYQLSNWGSVRLPIHIASGSAITIQGACNAATQTLTIYARGSQADVDEPVTRFDPIGTVGVAITTGQALTVDPAPAWTQVGVALTDAIRCLQPYVSHNNDTGRILQEGVLELGTSTGGAVTSLLSIPVASTASQIQNDRIPIIRGSFAVGTIFHARLTAATGGDTANVQLHGGR